MKYPSFVSKREGGEEGKRGRKKEKKEKNLGGARCVVIALSPK